MCVGGGGGGGGGGGEGEGEGGVCVKIIPQIQIYPIGQIRILGSFAKEKPHIIAELHNTTMFIWL